MTSSRRKSLGQHFLHNRKVLEKIIRVVDPQVEETVFEIGAGKGELTFPMARQVNNLICIEKDPELWPILENSSETNITLVKGDVLDLDFTRILPACPIKVVGNLPYSISTPLLFKIYAQRKHFTRCVFMLQKEVADRVCAAVGTKKLAPLSLLFQNRFETRLHFNVPPGSFSPPPKVDSAVISLTKR
ncbi:MAG: 16S rRNA (adenine(1518)-N(6)/adenine(1519)-N(6))-dimethyltransferase RsmA, partial [Candidatus Aminicenantes bacterium]|nr:16S rRNA (adenine(1518)-N(6)/adenine(1519)-N(6))-dimethyltransferase RsmA [Candidatus Aminicenantes bacterium]